MSSLFPLLEAPDERVVLRVDDRTLTARQLARRCAAHAERLARAGVEPGAHVGVWTQPSLETCVTLVANAATGFVTVPLDPKLGPRELGHIAGDARPVVTVAADPRAVEGRLEVPLLAADAAESSRPVAWRAADRAPLLVLYTSGTTGLPKGAVIAASSVAFDLDAMAEAWAWTSEDTVVHALPLFHVHGLCVGLFGALRTGGALHWVPRFDPLVVSAALEARRSMLFAVPTMYHRLAEAAASEPAIVRGLQAARVLVSGSAALPQRDQTRLEALTGKKVIERYGLTETLINTAVRVGAPFAPGSVGPALRGVELRLVDDGRRPVAPGQMGEVAVRGPNVFLGYLNRPDATAAVLDADGWFFTGDLATVDEAGHVRIVGRRATDLIKCGGYKVGASEVEAALLEHPLVREAAVVGRPDADLGERIVAFVVTSEPCSPRALEDHVARLTSPHKRPREVHLVSELPRNAMGKVVKSKLP
ncbi:MAG: AMP-binding protein [Myxococcaceae bacterium]|jgi:malonyl-CoA/methylmalonyl-CoA synthetase|nr:AMP-binding protein [Myxococcaceae bacterium]